MRLCSVWEPIGNSDWLQYYIAFNLAFGFTGYAAAPSNILTGFDFYEPFWRVDIANICVIVHLIGAYQVFAQPIFAQLEKRLAAYWPEATFINTTYTFSLPGGHTLCLSPSKLILRSVFILLTTAAAMLLLPFFNAVLGLNGALGFWPMAVYFPVKMHVSQNKIRRGAPKWIWLQSLSLICLLVSIGASVGSVDDIISSLKHAAPFKLAY